MFVYNKKDDIILHSLTFAITIFRESENIFQNTILIKPKINLMCIAKTDIWEREFDNGN